MTERVAWFCPSCQKHHGPHVDTCPGQVAVGPFDATYIPATPAPAPVKIEPMPATPWVPYDPIQSITVAPDPNVWLRNAATTLPYQIRAIGIARDLQ